MKKRVQDKVRVALVGTGGISAAHAKGFLAHKDKIECVALCDVSEKNLEARSQQLGGVESRFQDWREMLRACGDEIDAIDICLPHHLHAAAILDAAAAGKHILCEKPMCRTLAEADRIAKAVAKSGVTYMSAHNQLFMPVVQRARQMIETGAIGPVRWLRSQDCFALGPEALKGTWRGSVATQGGGELIDTGYHPTYRLIHLAGSAVTGVRGSMGRYRVALEGEDTAAVQVRFANGAIGEILTSWAFRLPHGTHQIHVIGDKGQIFGSNNTLFWLPEGASEPAKMDFPATDTFTAQIAHFADCLQTARRPIHSVEEGRQVLEIILKATRDAAGWARR